MSKTRIRPAAGYAALLLLLARMAVAGPTDADQALGLLGKQNDTGRLIQDEQPKLISSAEPVYPMECRRQGIWGNVVVEFVVRPDGTTTELKVVTSPDARLSQAAVDAVAKWRFIAGTQNGKAVYTHLRVPVSFGLQESSNGKARSLETVKPDHDPVVLFAARPQYPPEFVSKQVEGEVLVKFVVCPDGTTADAISLRSSDQRLVPFALQAVLRWKFRPGTKDGQPVYSELEVPIEFKASTPKPGADSNTAFIPASNTDSYLEKGNASLAAKSYSDAEAAFGEAIRSSPDTAPGYLGRARAFAGLGREDEAMEDFMRAASLDPSDKAALDSFKSSLPDTPERRWAALRYETFDTVWRTVNDSYYDPKFGGVDWSAVREKYRLLLPGAADDTKLIALVQQMLGELRRTHFAIIPRKAAVFNPAERVRIGTVGVDVAWIEGGVVVTHVRPGPKGVKAPLDAGDRITKVDGVDLDGILDALSKAGVGPSRSQLYVTQFVESRLSAAVGTKVHLTAAAPGATTREVDVTCGATDLPWSEPIGSFPSMPIQCVAERGADGVALLRFNVFVLPVMKRYRELEKTLVQGDSLIIDLRGNSGGITTIATGMSGWLCRDEFVLASMEQRTGHVDLSVYPQKHEFDGPVAILIDSQSASTSEVLAAGLKERHRARVFGEASAGAALPSLFKTLPTGDLMQYAIADIRTPQGSLIEGNGVAPDEFVAVTRAEVAAGRDPVEEAARRWIADARKAAGSGVPAGE
jgi:carboxyl-terminal processing protease